jgi:hypothetical protein
MRSYVLVKIGEMVLREALQCHMLASQGLGSREVCRVGVRDNCSKGKRGVRHAENLKGGLRCSGSKYNDVQKRTDDLHTKVFKDDRIPVACDPESFTSLGLVNRIA